MVEKIKRLASCLPGKGEKCLLQLTLLSDHFDEKGPVISDTCEIGSNLVVPSAIKHLYRVLQSKKKMPMDRTFKVHALLLKHPIMGASSRKGKFPVLSQWTKATLRFSTPAPDLSFLDKNLHECCLLLTLVMGFEQIKYYGNYAEMYRHRRRSLYTRYKKINTDSKALQTVARDLLVGAQDLCRRTGLAFEDFKLCRIDRDLDLKMGRIGVNINIFVPAGGFRLAYSFPKIFDPSKPVINVLAVPLEGSSNLYHTALIDSLNGLFSLRRKHMCLFCKHFYEELSFYFHKCSVMAQLGYEICTFCRMRVPRGDDYLDKKNARFCCDRYLYREGQVLLGKPDRAIIEKNPGFSCEVCSVKCLGLQCFKMHQRYCKKYKNQHCEECGSHYRKGKPHQCHKSCCYHCGCFYDYSSTHHCQMARPKPQATVSPLVVWDTETKVIEGRHFVNSVGTSFEHGKYGTFSEIYFYDDDLAMPAEKEGLHEKNFIFNYFPEGMTPPSWPSMARTSHQLTKKRKLSDFEQLYDADSGGEGKEEEDNQSQISSVSKHGEAEDWGAEVVVDRKGEETLEEMGDNYLGDESDDEEEDYAPPGSALDKFFKYFLDSGNFCNYTFLAHASSRFDSILILRALLKRNYPVQPVMDGNKVLMMEIPGLNVRFVDTFRYITVALENFPARFPDVIGDQGKGSFPYLFNQKTNYDYVGTIPSEDYFFDRFSPEHKKRKAREHIFEWRQQGKVWNFKEQLHAYLKQDIHLLRAGVVALNKEFLEFQQKLDMVPLRGKPRIRQYFFPFNKPFFTGSSFVHAVWRFYAMPADSLYLLTNQTNARKTSRGEREWMLWLSQPELMPDLVSMFTSRGGQKKIGPYYVDGCDEKGKEVYEYNGCLIHGHLMENPDCPLSRHLDSSSINPFRLSIKEAYEKFALKKSFLEEKGYSVQTKWECEWESERLIVPHFKSFLETLYAEGDLVSERLKIRDALRGGRTECFHLLYQKGEDSSDLLYYDKNSLYPHVAIDKLYPVGKHEVLIGEGLRSVRLTESGIVRNSDGKILQGLIQCTILPPDSLFLPVLPIFCRGKLLYGLCQKCMLTAAKGVCRHEDRERALRDTWTSIEVVHAIRCGYKVLKIAEMLIYGRSEPIFRDFYLNLARIKLESEGFPSGVVTGQCRKNKSKKCEECEEWQKRDFVSRINNEMPGLGLDHERVVKNQSRRNFAKFVSIYIQKRACAMNFGFVNISCCRCPMQAWGNSLRMIPVQTRSL